MSSYATQLNAAPLLNTILEKTQAGKLKWDDTPDEDIFLASVEGNTFKVQRKLLHAKDTVHRYTLSLLDQSGKLVWEIEEPWALTKEVFVLARRVALKVDERVDALIGTLQKL